MFDSCTRAPAACRARAASRYGDSSAAWRSKNSAMPIVRLSAQRTGANLRRPAPTSMTAERDGLGARRLPAGRPSSGSAASWAATARPGLRHRGGQVLSGRLRLATPRIRSRRARRGRGARERCWSREPRGLAGAPRRRSSRRSSCQEQRRPFGHDSHNDHRSVQRTSAQLRAPDRAKRGMATVSCSARLGSAGTGHSGARLQLEVRRLGAGGVARQS